MLTTLLSELKYILFSYVKRLFLFCWKSVSYPQRQSYSSFLDTFCTGYEQVVYALFFSVVLFPAGCLPKNLVFFLTFP